MKSPSFRLCGSVRSCLRHGKDEDPGANQMLLHTAHPLCSAGVLTESEIVTFPLAQTFTEQSHSPLAAIDVVLTGARPQDPPPRVAHGLLTVSVRMSTIL